LIIIIKFIFIFLGSLVCILAFWLQYMNRKAASWPATDGVIVKSELEPDSDGDSSVKITYRYTVNGRDFESSQFSFTALRNDLPAKKSRVAKYPVGQRVQVYYDPQKATSAVLERDDSLVWLGIVITGLVFIITALIIPA